MSTSGEKIQIKADPDLVDLLPGYLQKRADEVKQILTFLEEENFEEIRTLGHRMKGSGGGYGFEEISRIGADMEQSAIAKDAAKTKELLSQLEDYLNRVELI